MLVISKNGFLLNVDIWTYTRYIPTNNKNRNFYDFVCFYLPVPANQLNSCTDFDGTNIFN